MAQLGALTKVAILRGIIMFEEPAAHIWQLGTMACNETFIEKADVARK